MLPEIIPAETLQSEPHDDRAHFWAGFFAGAGMVLFWTAVGVGLWLAFN